MLLLSVSCGNISSSSAAAGEEFAVRGWEDDRSLAVLQRWCQRRCGADRGGENLCRADEGRVRSKDEEKLFKRKFRFNWIVLNFFKAVWQSILSNVSQIEDATDFFKSGAASMDVVR